METANAEAKQNFTQEQAAAAQNNAEQPGLEGFM